MQTIKAGDTAIEFVSTLVKIDSSGDWSLLGATVQFLLKKDSVQYSFPAEIVSTEERIVKYEVGVGFPTEIGRYSQEWEVIFSDGSILTFPNDSYNYFVIKESLN